VREDIPGGNVVGCVIVEVSSWDVGVICMVCLSVLAGSCGERIVLMILLVG